VDEVEPWVVVLDVVLLCPVLYVVVLLYELLFPVVVSACGGNPLIAIG
jgi:hypothetical protein